MSNSDNIYWSKNKELPPGFRCLIHNWVALLCLTQKPRLCGLSPIPAPTRPRKARTQSCRTSLCLISPLVRLLLRLNITWATIGTALKPVPGPVLELVWLPGPYGFLERTQVNEQRTSEHCKALIILPWVRGKFSFTLTNFLPNFLQVCSGPSLYPIPFLIMSGFHALILSDTFLRESQARLTISPYSHHFSSYCTCP